MTAVLVLAAYAIALGFAFPRVLARLNWWQRSPRLGILLWQALSASWILAVMLTGIAVAVPLPVISTDLATLLRACVMGLQAMYATPGGAVLATVGLAAAILLFGRAGVCVAGELIRGRRHRRRHLQLLSLVGRQGPRCGAVVFDNAIAAAYCLPGRRGPIVLTSGALSALQAEELDAVLAHELAHLRGRHHLLLASAAGLKRAFRRVPLFHVACEQTELLVEMLADDAAARRQTQQTVASALLTLGEQRVQLGVLAAGGPSVAGRAERLLSPDHPLGVLARAATLTAVAVALTVPVAVAVAPAAAAAAIDYCPLSWDSA